MKLLAEWIDFQMQASIYKQALRIVEPQEKERSTDV